ncbi:hypothetical protein F7Q99_26815 [Streptomyces kaniharaensis]|uniref:Gram-positive cocci surface proteins LPxTG domain-containing protein n=1 Tax=Streptomyces kaniharaensis TaxID=212423 RepID=A0A6N7KW78_9ACTN|nr:hypothetical protein [Streptomyces kaniharaensis]MQS15780.1 hypothetical protein [Streptomyces kaniharaensis]
MHSPRRTLPALAALGIAVGAPLLTAGTAHAEGVRCGDAAVQYSVDGGKNWINGGRMSEPHGVIEVRLTGESQDGCDYKVSLASYSTEGPTWATSGTQTFLGWATATLNHGNRQATLDVTAHLPKCFGQIDLYNGDKKFDGVANPAPKYPHGVFPDNLISAWNGGHACAPTPTGTPTVPVPTATASVTPSPTATATATPQPTASPTATTTATATAKPSTSATPSATPSQAATPSAPAPSASTDSAGPVGTPTVKPVSTTPAETLASTGGNSGQMIAYAAGGAALLAVGAGALVVSRRRASRR